MTAAGDGRIINIREYFTKIFPENVVSGIGGYPDT